MKAFCLVGQIVCALIWLIIGMGILLSLAAFWMVALPIALAAMWLERRHIGERTHEERDRKVPTQ
jgi:hypothetical protein